MHLHIISSGSSGNCYILQNENTALIIECGVSMKEIKQALDFNLNKVAGVIISHEHKDHCKAVNDVVAAGLNVFSSYGTLKAMNITHSHRVTGMEAMQTIHINDFKIMAFAVKHDAAEPFGFLINHQECGNVLFITDSYYVEHKFRNLNNIIVEANYDQSIVDKRLEHDEIHGMVRDRVIESHMSINTCKELLLANDLTAVNNIVLCHLSDGNSNAEDFKRKVEEITGKNVHVAGKNMKIDFNKRPF